MSKKSAVLFCGIYKHSEDTNFKVVTKAGEDKKTHKRVIDELFKNLDTPESKTRAFKSGEYEFLTLKEVH